MNIIAMCKNILKYKFDIKKIEEFLQLFRPNRPFVTYACCLPFNHPRIICLWLALFLV